MSLQFLQGAREIDAAFRRYAWKDENSTEANYTSKPCLQVVDPREFRLYLLIPSTVFTVALVFLQPVVSKEKECCRGRPGLIHPMDILARSNRFSFAAAFGSMAFLCNSIIFEDKYAIEYAGPTYVKVFLDLLSMLVYGIDYFPLFAGIALCNPIGYAVGTLFAWTFAGITFANDFGCPLEPMSYLLIVLRSLPQILCHVYLCISLPVRFVLSFKKRKKKSKFAVDFENTDDLYESIRKSYQGIHVRKLFKRPKPPPPEPENKVKKIMVFIKGLMRRLVYKIEPDFRYSARVISVMAVSLTLLYQVTVECIIYTVQTFGYAETFLQDRLSSIDQQVEGELTSVTMARYEAQFAYYVVTSLKVEPVLRDCPREWAKRITYDRWSLNSGCLLTSISVAFLLSCLMMLHSLASYRNLLLSLYKGNPQHLIPKEEKSYASSLVGSMRYAGYQVGYIAWGYIIHTLVLFAISVVFAFIYSIWPFIADQVLNRFHTVWPPLVISFVVNLIQLLMAKFVFLRDSGNIMAIDNRRFLFIFTYFMFFYNIFIGLVSCLLRILKAMFIGALTVPRLDLSTLPNKFQKFDPGFAAFCGFMHVECAHTNPVAMVFISVLQAESLTNLKHYNYLRRGEEEVEFDKIPTPGRKRAKWKWLLGYTLVRNPEMCIQRKFTLAKQNKQPLIDVVVDNSYFQSEDLCEYL